MAIYIQLGTYDALKALHDQHSHLWLGGNDEQAILIEETDGETILTEAKQYEPLDRVNELAGGSFAVLNNIAVTDEGRPQFEERFNNRARLIENEPGFHAIRVLRPNSDDTYVILTLWKDKAAFEAWTTSQSFNKAHAKRGTSEGIDQQKSIFPRPSFVSMYEEK